MFLYFHKSHIYLYLCSTLKHPLCLLLCWSVQVYGQCKAAIFINRVQRVVRLYKYDCVIRPGKKKKHTINKFKYNNSHYYYLKSNKLSYQKRHLGPQSLSKYLNIKQLCR